MVPVWPFYILGFVPAVVYFYLAVTGGLGADPVEAMEHKLGLFALQLLIASLLITPLCQIFRINLIRFRRMIGLMAFYYICLHLTVFLVLDLQLIPSLLKSELTKRPYIIVGLIGFFSLLPLALTSNDWAIRKLGAKRWGQIHKLAYVGAVAGAVHFIWSVKAWPLEPLIYGGIVAALLGYRFVRSRRRSLKAQVKPV